MAQPKGKLIAIGGAEDRNSEESNKEDQKLNYFEDGILETIIKEIDGKPKLELITTASKEPEEVMNEYKKAFRELGITIGHLHLEEREQANDPKILERVSKSNCVFFSGGDQLRLCSLLGGTELLDLIKEKYLTEPFVIAGTSAGAAAMSNTIIASGDSERPFQKGEVKLSVGFGFIDNVIIDTHFNQRGRFGRLAQAIVTQPEVIGIGLGEDAGVIIEKGNRMKAIGSCSVVVIDGKEISFSNIANVKDDMPISIENIRVHVLAIKDQFHLDSREYRPVKYPEHEKD